MSFFKKIKRAARGAVRAASSVVKSPVLKTVAAGVTIVNPPVGLGMTAALVASDKVLEAAKGSGGPQVQAAAQRTIANTVQLAKRGDPGAQRGVKALATAARMKKTIAIKGIPRLQLPVQTGVKRGYLVTPDKRIIRGTFRQVT